MAATTRDPRLHAWRSVPRALWAAARHFHQDEAGIRAAAIAYFALLSFFPFLLLLAAIASLFVGDSPGEVTATLRRLQAFMPFLADAFWAPVQDLVEHREVLSIASLGLLLFLATRVMVATDRAIGAIFRARRRDEIGPHAWTDRLRAWLTTVVALVALGLLFVTINAAEYVAQLERPGGWIEGLVTAPWIARRILPALVTGGLAYGLYRRAAKVPVAKRWALLGAGLFATGHDVGVSLYATWTARVARHDAFYGSFVGVVSFAVWVYLLSSLLLFGAEVVAELNGRPAQAARRA